MGDLIKTPMAEVTATLEILSRWGVQKEHLSKFRGASSYVQQMIARAIMTCDEGMFSAAKTELLQLVTTFQTEAVEQFVAKDKFKKDTSAKAKVKIYFLSDEFERLFIGKVEENVSAASLNIHKFLKRSADASIMAELGDRKETKLAQLWQMLEKQGNGEEGALLLNGWANIFYIIGTDGNFWAVDAHWFAGCGWYFYADSVGDPLGWYDGSQVASCDSLTA